jgi:cytochrome c-type protein NapC
MRNFIKKILNFNLRYPVIALILFFILGIIFWGGFNTAMELTNTEAFCISCHEMKENVYTEYKNTIHYKNRTGVRATCPDCHVPREWTHKFIRKVKATNELFHKIIGSIDTKEKFEAKRLTLATHVWGSMQESDSHECRNCHSIKSMALASQSKLSYVKHKRAISENMTCIDCHMGIAHQLPADFDNDGKLHKQFEDSKRPCNDCHKGMSWSGDN